MRNIIMRIFGKSVAAAVFGALLFQTGCQTDQYYQDRAVEKARSYLLKHSPELTQLEIEFVTYNAPVFLTAPILSQGDGTRTEVSSNQHQICVTWRIPGREYLYMVFGTSTGRMVEWEPNRLIRKRFVDTSLPLDTATSAARKYALNYLLETLDPSEYNLIRFTYPWVLDTNFPLAADPRGNLPPDEVAAARAKLELDAQRTLVWKLPGDDGKCMVFCGTGSPDLKGWAINFAGAMPQTELDEFTRRVLKTPAEANTPIPVEKEAEPQAVPPAASEDSENAEAPAQTEAAESAPQPEHSENAAQ